MADNLWPTDFGTLDVKTPVSILREQASGLGERTANIVVARTSAASPPHEGLFRHTLDLYCSPLNYQLTLLHVDHAIELYPAKIRIHLAEDGPHELVARTPEEFTVHLKDVFGRQSTKNIIASLIAQSTQ
jgi:hypothetical protein